MVSCCHGVSPPLDLCRSTDRAWRPRCAPWRWFPSCAEPLWSASTTWDPQSGDPEERTGGFRTLPHVSRKPSGLKHFSMFSRAPPSSHHCSADLQSCDTYVLCYYKSWLVLKMAINSAHCIMEALAFKPGLICLYRYFVHTRFMIPVTVQPNAAKRCNKC